MVNTDGQTNERMEDQTESWPPTSCHAIADVTKRSFFFNCKYKQV